MEGLELASELGICNIVLQFGSRCVIYFLQMTDNEDHQHVTLLGRLRELSDRDCSSGSFISIESVNFVTNFLSHLDHFCYL
ncbi:hypothetical protein LINGRAHAP2_LOCUS22240 [Linum grandiflorum]